MPKGPWPKRAPEPGAQLMSRRVVKLLYEHVAEEGEDVVRVHPFRAGVEMWALEDGALLLRSAKGQILWEDIG